MADLGHADSALAALKARYLANTWRFLTAPSGRVFPAQVFFLCMNGQTTQLSAEGTRYASVLVDITPVVERKVRAIDCLRSQYLTGPLARKMVEDVNGAAGLHWSLPYAEAFQPLYPHAYDSLPVNDYLMRLAWTPAQQQHARLRIMVADVPVDQQ